VKYNEPAGKKENADQLRRQGGKKLRKNAAKGIATKRAGVGSREKAGYLGSRQHGGGAGFGELEVRTKRKCGGCNNKATLRGRGKTEERDAKASRTLADHQTAESVRPGGPMNLKTPQKNGDVLKHCS